MLGFNPIRDGADHAYPPTEDTKGPTLVVQGLEHAKIPEKTSIQSNFST